MSDSETATHEQKSSYRWVMATVVGVLMTTSFISLSSFGILSNSIAETFNLNHNIVNILGIDSFSIGLFVAFFIGNGGFFDTKIKTGVLLSLVFLIIPQFIIPISYNLWLLTALRFFQGLMIMMLALFSIQLSGWFREDERGRSLAFALGAITLGSAMGGILSGVLRSVSWQDAYYITGCVMLVGAAIYFVFARDAPSLNRTLQLEKKGHSSAWRSPMTWYMGVIQLPITWTLFSMGGFLPSFSEHLGYSATLTAGVVTAWGISGFIAAFIGGIMGDRLVKGKKLSRDILNARLKIMTVAEICMGLGAFLIITLGGTSYYLIISAAMVNGFLMMFPPNYWALPGVVFPAAVVGAGAFGMGLISNSADAVGPLVSSALTAHWIVVFGIMVAISFVGVAINLYLSRARIRLPDEIL